MAKVKVWAAAVLPWVTLPKSTMDGVRLGLPMPGPEPVTVPVSVTACVVGEALSVTVRVAL